MRFPFPSPQSRGALNTLQRINTGSTPREMNAGLHGQRSSGANFDDARALLATLRARLQTRPRHSCTQSRLPAGALAAGGHGFREPPQEHFRPASSPSPAARRDHSQTAADARESTAGRRSHRPRSGETPRSARRARRREETWGLARDCLMAGTGFLNKLHQTFIVLWLTAKISSPAIHVKGLLACGSAIRRSPVARPLPVGIIGRGHP